MMIPYEKVITDLVMPLVQDKASLSIKQMPSLQDNEILLHVYADHEDISRLIGKKGSMASAIRQLVFVAFRNENKKVIIKFEAY